MTSTVLTDVEKNACLILPDLFLDIELNLPLNTLNKILRYDLFPIFIYILWSVAGEWMGFDEPSLVQQIEYQRMKPPGILTGCARSAAWLAFEGMVTLPWDQFKRKCSILFKRKSAPSLRYEMVNRRISRAFHGMDCYLKEMRYNRDEGPWSTKQSYRRPNGVSLA